MAQVKNAANDNHLQTKTDSITDQYVKAFLSAGPSIGLSIGIYINGRSYTYNYGEADKRTHRLPTANTLYNLASITKTITGVLLAQAQMAGKLHIGDDIRKYLSGQYPNLAWEGNPIRLYHLLNHTSGLPFLLPDKPEAFKDTSQSPSLIAAALFRHYRRDAFYADLHKVHIDTLPGTRNRYSNAAGQLCGYILESVYRKPFEVLMKEQLAKLAGMHDTKITISKTDSARFATGYDKYGNTAPYNPDQFQAAGAIKSTVNDMLRYIRWQLNESNTIVSLTHQPTTPVSPDGFFVGLNWSVYRSKSGVRAIWQNGNIPGASSWCIVYPELQMGIVLFANQSDPTISHRLAVLGESIMIALDAKAPEF